MNPQITIEERGIESDKYKTLIAKDNFISEMKNGLGNEIKQTGGIIKVKKVPFLTRLFKRIMDTF